MKLKKNKRLIISFVTLGLFFVGALTSFFLVKGGPRTGGAPTLLRHAFMWNEDVWKILKSNKRLSVDKPRPLIGKKPRVNGSLGLKSPLDISNYKILVLSGNKKLDLTVEAFKVVPKEEYSTDFRCIEGWSEELHYGGSRFRDFMAFYDLGKKEDGTYYSYVALETPDRKYYVSIDMESMLHDQTLLAYEMNGKELDLANGAPLRLIIPVKYGIKSLKRIGKIYFSDKRPPDYWAQRGYDWYSGL